MRLAALAAAVLLAGGPQLVERSVYLMGTRATVRVWSTTRLEGLSRIEEAIRALEATERQLSTWVPDSALTSLNQQPLHLPWRAEPSLCALLGAVADWQKQTNGAFDPAIGSLLDLWGVHGDARVPSDRELWAARGSSGFQHLDLDRAQCTVVRRQDARIDSGAFGKGEALDRAARVLAGSWMIDLGGQVSADGASPDGSGWRVGIAHPHDRRRAVLEVTIGSGSLSTSGGSERDRVVAGRRVGHILDPRTGTPASFTGSVSVWHSSGLVADVLSTALYVMGPAEGLAWAGAQGFAACYLEVDATGHVSPSMTAAFRPLLRP